MEKDWLIEVINDPTISDEEKLEIMEEEGFDLEDMFQFVLQAGENYAAG